MFLEEAGRTDAFPYPGSGWFPRSQGWSATGRRPPIFSPSDQALCRVPGYVGCVMPNHICCCSYRVRYRHLHRLRQPMLI